MPNPAPGGYTFTGTSPIPPFLTFTMTGRVPTDWNVLITEANVFAIIPEPTPPTPGPGTGIVCTGTGTADLYLGGVKVATMTCTGPTP